MSVLTWPAMLEGKPRRRSLLDRVLRPWLLKAPYDAPGGGSVPGGGGTGGGSAATSSGATGVASPASGGGGAARAGSAAGNLMPWLFPTADFLNLDVGPSAGFTGQDGAVSGFGAVALPAIGATATILKFQIPSGRNGKITALGIDFIANGGAVFNQGILPAPLTFQILANGKPLPGYESFNYSPGAVSSPIPIAGLMVKESQIITVLVTNNNIVVTTQFVAARVQGYTYSKNLEPQILSYQ